MKAKVHTDYTGSLLDRLAHGAYELTSKRTTLRVLKFTSPLTNAAGNK